MPNHPKTDAEKAMAAHAGSLRRQGQASDEAIRKSERRRRAPNPATSGASADPRVDPAEDKR